MPFLLYECDPAHAVGSTAGRVAIKEFKRRHLCPECHAEFSHDVEVGEHLTTQHPILQPHVLLGGTRIPTNWIVRQPVTTATFRIMNATEVFLGINGNPLRPTSSDEVRELLVQTSDGVLELHLRNRSASQRYNIRVLVPEPDELRRVDAEFAANLARTDVTVSDVRHYGDILSVGPAAREYAAALADYVYGVLAKDGAGQTTLVFEAFVSKFKQSLDIVRAYDRPLATAIASCIRFNLNDFQGTYRPCGVQVLDRAHQIFQQLSLGNAPRLSHEKPHQATVQTPLCPIDSLTQKILNVVGNPKPNISTLRDMASRPDLSHEDHVKVCVLIAHLVPDLPPGDAANCQAALAFDPVFGQWATRVLRVRYV